MIHIIIPVHNRIDHTRNCLESLVNQELSCLKVLLIDDGSTDDTEAIVLREVGDRLDIEILTGAGELFWGGAIEMGMRQVLKLCDDDDLLMTLNNDAILPPDYLAKATEILARNPGSMVGGISFDDSGDVALTGWRMKSWPLALTERVWWPRKREELEAEKDEVIDVDFLPGTAVLAPVELVRRAGPVNGRELRHYHADSEFAWRVKKSGGRVLVARDLWIQHDLDATGIASGFGEVNPLELVKSFFSIRSGNSLKFKVRFARLCCPLQWRWAFLISDTIKVFSRGVLCCFSGNLAARLKSATNPQKLDRRKGAEKL